MFDVDAIEAHLQAVAAARADCSYSQLLMAFGHRFTRPRMRALCRVLDAIDDRARAAGQPELAALVVRESDRLPGQGWWLGRRDHAGGWEGTAARRYLDAVQAAAFDFWADRAADPVTRR